ncbi:hypothetical protein ACFOND_00040 [Reinekea marina]|uniref:DUF7079 domain-containing protein n=1 Tax=Reinekea marina TaxID=1310421 RepID=A0ABV7WLC5_9GAMM
MMSQINLNKRKPVWVALSDLFLDTDVTRYYENIVRVCVESDYSPEEIRLILFDEVAPAVSKNLLSVAGEWSGFDKGWLIEEIIRGIRRKKPFFGFLNKWTKTIGIKHYLKEHWSVLEPRIVALRDGA